MKDVETGCQSVQEAYVGSLAAGRSMPPDIERHVASCAACHEELQGLSETWNALASLPVLEPSPRSAVALRCRLLKERAREAIAPIEGWQTAALTGVVGFVLSVLLAILVPYETMVDVCRQIVTEALPSPGIYLLAGVLYGLVPMAISAAFQARKAEGVAVVHAAEAAVVFLVVLVPYMVLRCSEFPPALFAGFLAGIAAGAVAGGGGATWLSRRRAWA
jgi:hypothetical protein